MLALRGAKPLGNARSPCPPVSSPQRSEGFVSARGMRLGGVAFGRAEARRGGVAGHRGRVRCALRVWDAFYESGCFRIGCTCCVLAGRRVASSYSRLLVCNRASE
jgi:hypothetical protein